MACLIGERADWIVLLSAIVWLIYYLFIRSHNFWKKRGVPYLKPLPLFGNLLPTLILSRDASLEQQKVYNQFKNVKYYGTFSFQSPVLVVKDPDLIETVLIKDFTSFYNRGIKVDTKLDRIAQTLVNLRDQQWRSLRNKLSPAFTSGKLKMMHSTMLNCSESLVEILNTYASSGKPFEAREIMADFTIEAIGHCVLGLEINTLKNPNSEFRRIGREYFSPSTFKMIRFFIMQTFPKLLSWLRWKKVPENVEQFFIDLIKETMASRQAGNIEVHDFLNLLITLRKENQPLLDKYERGEMEKPENELFMDDLLMASNAAMFFLAGYETTSSTLSSCLFELTQNPDAQNKLREEVRSVLAEHGGILSNDAIKKMSYLDNVISETLRKHPPILFLPRECTKEWKIPGTDIVLPIGTILQIPLYSIHHDPEYYPEPDKFMPKRFAEVNSYNTRKGTFLPFGDGPRICIGLRFARSKMKIALAKMILNFEFTLNKKTELPIVLRQQTFFLIPKGGYWINASKIK